MSFVARGPTDPSAVLELHLLALVTKDLQAEDADGSNKRGERSTRLRQGAESVTNIVRCHAWSITVSS
jgi:hypothetical protein